MRHSAKGSLFTSIVFALGALMGPICAIRLHIINLPTDRSGVKFFILPIIFILPLQLFGQMLFGTGGGSFSGGQNQIDFSIGETTIADMAATPGIVNIGFQQPYYDFFTSAIKPEPSGYQLFPNPFSKAFRFEASAEIESYLLLDASGREVFQAQTTGTAFEYKVSGLPKGFYQLLVLMKDGRTISTKVVHE